MNSEERKPTSPKKRESERQPQGRVVLVPPCLLCAQLAAETQKKNTGWRRELLSYLVESGDSFLPLPCPESTFFHPQTGLGRPPHGVQFYEALEGFGAHCAALSRQTAEEIAALTAGGLAVRAILGVEHSPTCAVNYIYTHRGCVRRSGIFMERLRADLDERNLAIPILGINRRSPKKVIAAMEGLRTERENYERD